MAIKGVLPSGEQMERIVTAVEKIAAAVAASVPAALSTERDEHDAPQEAPDEIR